MPVRCWIHASDVSTRCASSALVTMRAGSAAPTPRTRERRMRVMERARFGSLGGGRMRMRRGGAGGVGLRDHFTNLAEQFLAHHVVAQFDGAGISFGVGAAMGLDDDAVKPKKHAPAGPRAYFLAQSLERLAREHKPDAGHQAVAHRVTQVVAELSRRAFGGFQR